MSVLQGAFFNVLSEQEKICLTYFKICLTYFKIQGTYFSEGPTCKKRKPKTQDRRAFPAPVSR